ncbi:MAG: PKD domain-containing protein, partial [Gammaproteobacteria bacterium]
MSIKRIVNVFGFGLLVCLIQITTVNAATNLRLGDLYAQPVPGSIVNINISLLENIDAVGLQLDVLYDGEQLTAGKATTVSNIQGSDYQVFSYIPANAQINSRVIRVVIIPPASNPVIQSGPIASIPFALSGTVNDTSKRLHMVNASVLLSDNQAVEVIPGLITDGLIVMSATSTIDTDGDGVSDYLEALTNAMHPLIADGHLDYDGDGLTNLEEILANTDPTLADSDADGIPDQFEILNPVLDPLVADGHLDYDGDGLTNLQEYQRGTDLTQLDTDADGINDGVEVSMGRDPLVDQVALWANSMSRQLALVVDASTVNGPSDLTNFPVYVDIIHDDLRSVLNGGFIESESGNDIAFFAGDLTTLLHYELINYDPVQGALEAWVKLDTLSTVAVTDLYLKFGNVNATFSLESGMEKTWSSTGFNNFLDLDGRTGGVTEDHLTPLNAISPWLIFPNNPPWMTVNNQPDPSDDIIIDNYSMVLDGTQYHMFYNYGPRSQLADLRLYQFGYATAPAPDAFPWQVENGGNPIPCDFCWYWAYNSPRVKPAIIKEGTTFKMWFSSANPYFPYDGSIYYKTSQDGINWTAATKVFSPSGDVTAFDSTEVLSPIVIKDGATYRMWYSGVNGVNADFTIGYATSSDGITWTRENAGQPTVTIASGAPFAGQIHLESVIKDGDVFRLWYSGTDVDFHQAGIKQGSISNMIPNNIGYATSKDGITWSKYLGNPIVRDTGATQRWYETVSDPYFLLTDDPFWGSEIEMWNKRHYTSATDAYDGVYHNLMLHPYVITPNTPDKSIRGNAVSFGTNNNAHLNFGLLKDINDTRAAQNFLLTGDFTLSTWVTLRGITTSPTGVKRVIMAKESACGPYIPDNETEVKNWALLNDDAGQIIFDVYNYRADGTENIFTLNSIRLLNDSLWHQVTITRQSGAYTLYIDGEIDASYTPPTPFDISSKTAPLIIGSSNCKALYNTVNFEGGIDEVSFSGVARNDAWIKTEYLMHAADLLPSFLTGGRGKPGDAQTQPSEVVVQSSPADNPPIQSSIGVSSVVGLSAVINWQTNKPATSQILYGVNSVNDNPPLVSNISETSHSMVITGLVPNTTYQYQVINADDMGKTTTSGIYTFKTINAAPVVDAGPDIIVDEGGNVQLVGSAFDEDSTIQQIAWSQIIGSTIPLSGSSAYIAGFTAPQVNGDQDYVFQLTVKDNFGAVGIDVVLVHVVDTTVVVPNQMPVANIGGPYIGEAGLAITFDASASSDADGDALTYAWDFGDGSLGNGVAPVHTYAQAGSYTATLIVNDGVLDSLPITTSVTIGTVNTAPEWSWLGFPDLTPGGPEFLHTNIQGDFVSPVATDADGDSITYRFNWGDGTTDDALPAISGTGVTLSHSWTTAGIYQVKVTAIDSSGAQTNAASPFTINGESLPLTVIVGDPLTIDVTQPRYMYAVGEAGMTTVFGNDARGTPILYEDLGGNGRSVETDRNGNTLYVANPINSTLSVYNIGADAVNGSLALLETHLTAAYSVVAHPILDVLFVRSSTCIDVYDIQADGTLIKRDIASVCGLIPGVPTGFDVDPGGQYLVDTSGDFNSAEVQQSVYALDVIDGTPYLIESVVNVSSPSWQTMGIAFGPQANGTVTLYLIQPGGITVSAVSLAGFTEIQRVEDPAIAQELSLVVDPQNKFLYVASYGVCQPGQCTGDLNHPAWRGNISVWKINNTTGANFGAISQIAGSPVASGFYEPSGFQGTIGRKSLIFDPTGSLLYFAGSKAVWTYQVNPATGDIAATNVVDSTGVIKSLTLGRRSNNVPPTIVINAPLSIETTGLPGSVQLDASLSTDDVAIASYQWEQISGPPNQLLPISGANTAIATVTTPDTVTISADFTFQVTVTDTEGAISTASVIVTILPPNFPPVADPGNGGVPYTGIVGDLIGFDGSASWDPNGDVIQSYTWDFGDGSIGVGVSPTHAYLAAGTYTATLNVNDGVYDSGPVAIAVEITAPPVIGGTVDNVILDPASATVSVNAVQTLTAYAENTTGQDLDSVTIEYNYPAGVTLSNIQAADGATQMMDDPGKLRVRFRWRAGDPIVNGPNAGSNSPGVAAGEKLWASFDVSGNNTGDYLITPRKIRYTDLGGNRITGSSNDAMVSVIQGTPVNEPPIAIVGGPYNGTAGTFIGFNGTQSSDPEGAPITYAWDFGDGMTGFGAVPNHAYSAVGSYTVTLVVNDGVQDSASSSTTVTVVAANTAPVANAGGPYSGDTGTAIAFDGTQSSDADGDALTYAWNFGDGSTGTGANPSHAYTAVGNYTVSLIANDGTADSVASTATVTITAPANTAPIANAGGPYGGKAGTLITFDGSLSSDPDGDALSYAWDFGDGTTGTGVNPGKGFAEGIYTVTLVVSDGQLNSAPSTTTLTVTAANVAPRAIPVISPNPAVAGQTVTLDGSGSTDDTGIVSYLWEYTGTQAVTIANPTAATTTFTAPAVTVQTLMTFRLTVIDGDGAVDARIAQVGIDVANTAPVAVVGGPYSGDVNTAIAFDGTQSSDADGDALTYAWNFGDGSTGTGANPSHAYTAVGNYTVSLIVNDGTADSVADSVTAMITDPVIQSPAQDITWTDLVGVVVEGTILRKTAARGWNGGAASLQNITADGYIEYITDSINYRVFGLSDVNVDEGYINIDYAAYTLTDQTLRVWENGVQKFSTNYTVGDVVRVERTGGTVVYKQNGTIIYTSLIPSTGNLIADVALINVDSTIPNAVISGAGASSPQQQNTVPLANAGGPYSGEVNAAIIFDGSQSTDADGNALTYAWNFGDGSTGTGANPAHSYVTAGTYTVNLTVNDGQVDSATSTATVNVANPPPAVGGSVDNVILDPASATVSVNAV